MDRRYAGANRLADDLSLHLAGRPVSAGPDTWRYRTARLVRRNRLAAATLALAVLGLLGGTVAATLSARRARHAATEEHAALRVEQAAFEVEAVYGDLLALPRRG